MPSLPPGERGSPCLPWGAIGPAGLSLVGPTGKPFLGLPFLHSVVLFVLYSLPVWLGFFFFPFFFLPSILDFPLRGGRDVYGGNIQKDNDRRATQVRDEGWSIIRRYGCLAGAAMFPSACGRVLARYPQSRKVFGIRTL